MCKMTTHQHVHIHPLLTGYVNGIEEDWKKREVDLGPLVGKRVFRIRELIWHFGCSWMEDAAAPKYMVLGATNA